MTPEELSRFDQNAAITADILPPLWRRMYEHLLKLEFERSEAMEILKTYIMSTGTIRI